MFRTITSRKNQKHQSLFSSLFQVFASYPFSFICLRTDKSSYGNELGSLVSVSDVTHGWNDAWGNLHGIVIREEFNLLSKEIDLGGAGGTRLNDFHGQSFSSGLHGVTSIFLAFFTETWPGFLGIQHEDTVAKSNILWVILSIDVKFNRPRNPR
jgi:hypothetical protein